MQGGNLMSNAGLFIEQDIAIDEIVEVLEAIRQKLGYRSDCHYGCVQYFKINPFGVLFLYSRTSE